MYGLTTLDCAEAEVVPVTIVRQGMSWLIAPDVQELLLDNNGLRLDEWLRAGQATVVKKGPHRVVYRVELPELSFFIKHNLIPDFRSWLRQLVRPGKALREYRRALAVAACGVLTVQPLAVGEAEGALARGDSYLITRGLPETVQLNQFLQERLPALPRAQAQFVRKQLALRLGELIARLHDCGILHNDLHCGNILIRLEDDWPTLYLIDLQAVRHHGPLNWRQSQANLVMFNRWLTLRASRADRLRFWRAYVRNRDAKVWAGLRCCERGQSAAPLSPDGVRRLACQIEHATRRSNERFWRRREQRCLQTTRHHRKIKSDHGGGYAVTDLEPGLLNTILADPDAPFRRGDAVVLKDSRSARVVEFSVLVGGQQRQVIYKRIGVTKWLDPVLALFRLTPALRSWLYGHSLRERGLPTARPLLVFHRRRFGLPQEGYLLMERVNSAGDLRGEVARLGTLGRTERQALLRRRLEHLARLVRDLHNRHLAHRDLKAANILMDADTDALAAPYDMNTEATEETAPAPYCFIDLVGVSRGRRIGMYSRVKNLARLHASFHDDPRLTRTDKLRFLRVYLQWGLLGKEGWKEWWHKIEAATRRKVAKNLRNRRPLA